MYKYYAETISEEHMLYAQEIAELYNVKQNLIASDKELTAKKVSSFIYSYCKKNNIDSPKLFFKHQYGLKRVYQKEIYEKALEEYGYGKCN